MGKKDLVRMLDILGYTKLLGGGYTREEKMALAKMAFVLVGAVVAGALLGQ